MTLQVLSSGLDALYLSGATEVRPFLLSVLEARRESAAKQGNMPVPLGHGPDGITVGWGSWDLYRFRPNIPMR